MHTQLKHSNTPKSEALVEVHLIVHLVESPANLGALFRLADAFGVCKMYVSTSQLSMMESNRFKRMARSTEKYLQIEMVDNDEALLKEFNLASIPVYALESTSQSQPIELAPLPTKLALIIGAERNGIPSSILELSDASYHIPLYGNNSSINVAQATAIALYALHQRK